jgi:two-component system CitB family sensor kinase
MRRSRRLSTQILFSQLAILLVASVAGLLLFVQAARRAEDQQYEQRALAIAQATAAMPGIVAGLAHGDRGHDIASLAELVRARTHAAYVVVIDRDGVRHSHPDPSLIGIRVIEPVVALDGRSHTGVDNGHLGRSANGKAPVVAADGSVVGEVSAGILESQVSASKAHELMQLALYAVVALSTGVLASLLLTRRLKRQTFGLELQHIAELLQEREAMLHGIREGVVTLDPQGRVSLVNDEARRLLGLGFRPPGYRLDEVVPAGRLHDLLTGDVAADDDEVVLTDEFCLKVNRMPVRLQGRDLGAVVTVRDRTEYVGLLRELDSVGTLTEALRGQQHEHANRMHTVAGLLELGRPTAAADYLEEISGHAAGLAEELRDRVGNMTIVALLLGKVTIARERGVPLIVQADAPIDDAAVDQRVIVTVLGNLIDNALDAVSGQHDARIEVRFELDAGRAFIVQVADNGPGIPEEDRARVFVDGYSTRPSRTGFHRGLGLALVHRLVTKAGGRVSLDVQEETVFTVSLPVRRRSRSEG